ncbi:sulfatase-like hydrolase/transferase [Pirellulimonas nuda]|uniref:sulfatase-like hydrolase/transferase n=1 Tax=Pirellulimonas nuda TaxID=2528009 RepID=UPI0018D37D2D|nr:sulfatase-like hydrolase/transferase [Pirellulimonas nuda]
MIVVFVDDMGYADVGLQGTTPDVRTPHIDRLGAGGVHCTAGYITAPQCSPSRAGLITGRYQQRFGMDSIADCPLPLEETTLSDRLSRAGYTCGMVGKWHLSPHAGSLAWARTHARINDRGQAALSQSQVLDYYPHKRGFQQYFVGERNRYYANYSIGDKPANDEAAWTDEPGYRIDIQTEAALEFIRKNKDNPFFLDLNYFAPHVPLAAPQEYLDRFPGPMPERRRYALAMISAVDDGVGRLLDLLDESGTADDTLIFFTSDNGAPLALTQPDKRPIDSFDASWDGSLNDPWIGEKGMLSEGGIRVPFLVRWPAQLPAGRVYPEPVSSLDIAATALAAAGAEDRSGLDGVDICSFLAGDTAGPPHDYLFWRFWSQAAVRSGKWKYLTAGDGARAFLFDLTSDEHECQNLLEENPQTAARLRRALEGWASELRPAGIPSGPMNPQEQAWYSHYFPTAPE